jgi:Ca-activated chloride channel family protein
MGRLRPEAITFGLLAAALAGIEAYSQEQVFRVDVRLVRLLATVKDKSGTPVGGLAKEDFTVYDNGVRQQIAIFERHTAQPLSVAVLMDVSGSTNKEIQYEISSTSKFLTALFGEGNPQDTAALYSFNWQVVRNVPYARDLKRFEREMRKLKGEAGTSLYDAIFLAAEDIQARAGRHVMVLVTDGGDTTSSKTFHQAREAVHRADAVLYPILVMPVTNDAGRNIGGENALTLLAQSTGGKLFAPGVDALDTVFAEILRDLRTQYLLGFYPRNVPLTKEKFHEIKVKTSRPDLRVVTRTGYYGEFEASNR